MREFLHIEIWSKKTSRKIFIAFGVIAIAFAVFYEVDTRWTSPNERRAAKDALSQLDALQASANGTDYEYEAMHRQAEKKVDHALASGITSRDKVIALQLSMYLMATESQNETHRFNLQLKMRQGNTDDKRIQDVILENEQMSANFQHALDLTSRSMHSVLD